jgi:HEPN domain-containing protein
MSPQDKERLPASPEEWVIHARSDLTLAQIGRDNCNVLHEQICFHTQQAAEKALKAVLLFYKVDFPLTHDLDELVDILEQNGISLSEEILNIGILTPYAVEARYPGYWDEITEHDVEDALKLAEKMVLWAGNCIQKK